MSKYRYNLYIKNNAFRGEEMSLSVMTNRRDVIDHEIENILNYGNIDFKVLVNDDVEEEEA
jgi:hypothetical protein